MNHILRAIESVANRRRGKCWKCGTYLSKSQDPRLIDYCPTCDTCLYCGTRRYRDEKHDSYACPKCDIWLEKGCSHPDCEFCSTRPPNPSDVPNYKNNDEYPNPENYDKVTVFTRSR